MRREKVRAHFWPWLILAAITSPAWTIVSAFYLGRWTA